MLAQRNIVIKTNKEAEVSAEELYRLFKASYQQWTELGIYTPAKETTLERFIQDISRMVVLVVLDADTNELLGMHALRLNKQKGRADGYNLAVSPKAKHEGIASRMLEAEAQRLRKAGYKYLVGSTGTPATWSVKWHLKNGYYIVGYSRSERNPRALLAPTFRWENYASYIFRKQIAIDLRHHPTDLLWTKPIAPVTAKLRYCLTWMATMICKDNSGKLNAIGRIAKKLKASIR